MAKERIEYFDILRGIAVLCVIAIHCYGCKAIGSNTLTYHLAIIWRQFIGFPVPLFITLSGFFLARKDVSNCPKYLSFLGKQVPRVYIPMLIWASPHLLLAVYKGKSVGMSLFLYVVGGYSVYYFIVLIIQYYLLLPIIQKYSSRIQTLIVAATISAVCMLILFYLTDMRHLSIRLIAYAGFFPVWIVFFVLGVFLGKKRRLSFSVPILVTATIIGLLLSIGETYLRIYLIRSPNPLGIKLSTFVYSFAIILLLFALRRETGRRGVVWRFMVYMGRISFGVFLTHMFFIQLVTRVISRFYLPGFFVYQLVLFSLSTLCCVGFITAVRKINQSLAVKYLGF